MGFRAVTLHEVWCNDCGEEPSAAVRTEGVTRAGLSGDLRRYGWAVSGSRVRCPKCRTNVAEAGVQG